MFHDSNDRTAAHPFSTNAFSRKTLASALTLGVLALAGCGGGSDGGATGDAGEITPRNIDTAAPGGDTVLDGGTTGGNTVSNNDGTGDPGITGGLSTPEDVPASLGAFQASVYPLITGEANCSICHTDNGVAVNFASASSELSHENVLSLQLVDLVNPENSRLVERLRDERHNCWSGADGCADDAAEMLMAIQSWADQLGDSPEAMFNPLALSSAAIPFSQQTTEAAQLRVTDSLVAFYDFKGSGDDIIDVSGAAPALNLTLQGEVTRIENGGLRFAGGSAIASAAASQKLFDSISASMSYTVEAWVTPENDTQTGPARIISYSNGTGNRNFTVAQQAASFDFRARLNSPDLAINNNGQQSVNGGMVTPATMQHVVATFDAVNGRTLFVDGVEVASDNVADADLSTWSNTFQFVLGNETTGDRSFAGDLHLAAVYEKALTPAEVQTNFEAGLASTRSYLDFDISAIVNTPGAMIRFEVRDFDESAYFFAAPTVISEMAVNFDLSGMRIAVNDSIPVAGQSFANLTATASGTESTLTTLGAVIAKDQGAKLDQFRLVFDEIAGQMNLRTPAAPIALPLQDLPIETPEIGIKTFDDMYATLATLTGVDSTNETVLTAYREFSASLPSNPDAEAYSGATQTVVTKLAIEFCDVWVDSGLAASGVLSDFNLSESPATGFNAAGSAAIAGTMANHFFNGSLSGQPLADATMEMTLLLQNFSTFNSMDNGIKAACAAATASAAVMLQ